MSITKQLKTVGALLGLDCGDNSCLFAVRAAGGMRTNGGCQCDLVAKVTELRAENAALTGLARPYQLIEAERQRTVPDAPVTLEDNYALSRRVCHGQADQIDKLHAELTTLREHVRVLREAVDPVLDELECARLQCWCFTRAAMNGTQCTCPTCAKWLTLSVALNTTDPKEPT